MSDIFISYSRKDSEHALELAERLRAEGREVWIDQLGIGGAEEWATEIAQAIRECKSFLLLLSRTSTDSPNVLKELSLASEKGKRIIPVDLAAAIELPVNFEYALAGIQRVAYGDFTAVLSAITSGPKRLKAEQRKSLMILPFEDLSPTHDNEWFADGIASELIVAFSNVKSLRLIDWNTSKQLSRREMKTVDIARELEVRYFLQGSVRKFGDQIKITATLLDIHHGDYLWQLSEKGTMQDIFELQEAVAAKVVEGLKLHLTPAEKSRLEERGTENAEAYELYVKARQYCERHSKEDFIRGLGLFEQARRIDPDYAEAYLESASALVPFYAFYDRDPNHLIQAQEFATRAHELKPSLHVLGTRSTIELVRGNLVVAEELAREYIREAPDDWESHFKLGLFYSVTNNPIEAAPNYARSIELHPESLTPYWNLLLILAELEETTKLRECALSAIPIIEKYLRLNPDDQHKHSWYAIMLFHAGRVEEASAYLNKLDWLDEATSLYNLAYLATHMGDARRSMELLKRSIDAGYSNIEQLRNDKDFDHLRELPEFIDLMEHFEAKLHNV